MLQHDKKKSVLMVMPDAFHQGWMGATRRLFHITKALQRLNFDVILLAGRMTNPELQRNIDSVFPGIVLRTNHSGDYPIIFERSALTKRLWRGFWKVCSENVYWSKLSWGWAERLNVKKIIKTLHDKDLHPMFIWGVSAGYLEGAVAAENIANEFKIPWIFELHDPPRRAGLGPDLTVVKRRFQALLGSASCIVVTAESYEKELVEHYGTPPQKIMTIHLTYEGKIQVNDKPRNKKFTMVYAGSLSGDRSLKSVILALKESFEKCPVMKDSFELLLAGDGPGFDEIKEMSDHYGLAMNMSYLGKLPGDMVYELLAKSDVVINMVAEGNPLQIPGKTFELISTGKPILGIMSKEHETAYIMRQSGLGFIHELSDIKGISNTLIQLWKAWKQGNSLVQPNYDYIQSFSIEHLPSKIAHVLKCIDNEAID